MNKQIIASILIPALLLQVIGCYSINEITNKDIHDNRVKILQITLKNGRNILFNRVGGKYLMGEDGVEGQDENGRYINLPLTAVKELYSRNFIPVTLMNYDTKKINFVLTKKNILFEFGMNGGKIDTNKKVIRGYLGGNLIEIATKDVKEIYKEKPKVVSLKYFKSIPDSTVHCVQTESGYLINLDHNGGKYISYDGKIIGTSAEGDSINVNLREIRILKIEEMEGLMIGIVIVGSLGLFFLLLYGISQINVGIGNMKF